MLLTGQLATAWPNARPEHGTAPVQAEAFRKTMDQRSFFASACFTACSMAPKIEAAIWYLENGGKEALITNPENIGRALKGETGTRIVP